MVKFLDFKFLLLVAAPALFALHGCISKGAQQFEKLNSDLRLKLCQTLLFRHHLN